MLYLTWKYLGLNILHYFSLTVRDSESELRQSRNSASVTLMFSWYNRKAFICTTYFNKVCVLLYCAGDNVSVIPYSVSSICINANLYTRFIYFRKILQSRNLYVKKIIKNMHIYLKAIFMFWYPKLSFWRKLSTSKRYDKSFVKFWTKGIVIYSILIIFQSN